MEGKRLSDDNVLKTDPRYRKLEHLIQVSASTEREYSGAPSNNQLYSRAVARVRSRKMKTWL